MHLDATLARRQPLVLAAVESELARITPAAGIDASVLHHEGRAFVCAGSRHPLGNDHATTRLLTNCGTCSS